jgi:RNA-binding protein YlmH
MNLSQVTEEETLLLRRLADQHRIASSSGKPRFSPFLNEREGMLAAELIRQRKLAGCRLFGGFPDAARTVFGAFSEYEEPDDAAFPIVPVAIRLPKGASITHRDVLGSLMSMQIKRESVGDILIRERRCDVFLLETVAGLVLGELTKIGGTGVSCEAATETAYERTDTFDELRGTVMTPRADAIVSLLANLSRGKASDLIRAEQVQRNHQTLTSVSADIAPGDTITIRRVGKFIIDETGGPTKKGRLPILYRRYK